jgi:hypothetical protein
MQSLFELPLPAVKAQVLELALFSLEALQLLLQAPRALRHLAPLLFARPELLAELQMPGALGLQLVRQPLRRQVTTSSGTGTSSTHGLGRGGPPSAAYR